MGMTPGAADGPPRSGMAHVVEHNIRALLAHRRQEEQQANWQDRLADRITAFTGSLRFVYLEPYGGMADKRADLDLQVSLLAEHEITRLITLVTAMAERMGIDAAQDPELAELAQDVAPEKVLDTMDAHHQRRDEGEPRAEER